LKGDDKVGYNKDAALLTSGNKYHSPITS